MNLSQESVPAAAALQSAYLPDGLYFHPHWAKYEQYMRDTPDWVHWGIGMYMAFVCSIAILGNILVLAIFGGTRSLRTPSNVFVINLAISDLGFSMVNGFPLMTISCFHRVWIFGPLACQLYAAFGAITGFNSIGSLALISYDRYTVISNPLEAMRTASAKRSFFKCLILWFWAGFWAFQPLFGWGSFIPEGLQTSCSFDYLSNDWNNFTYNVSIFVFGFCFPFFSIIYSYINIINAVASQASEMAKTAERMGAQAAGQEHKARQQEIALAKVAAGTITLFLISWWPYAFIAESGVWGYYDNVTPTAAMVPIMACKASAMWNPIIYALSHPRFRAQLEARFPSLLCCAGSNIDRGDDKSGMSMSASGTSEMSTVSDVGA